MRAPRVYIDQPLAVGREVRLDAASSHHLLKVLRARPGEALVVFNGDGMEYACELSGADPGECRVEILQAQAADTESPLAVTLVQAVGKGDRMDWCIQKSVELGVAAIVPVFTERTEVRLDAHRAARRQARWRDIAIAACQQSGRVRVPEIAAPVPLMRLQAGPGTRLYLDPDGDLSPGGMGAPADCAVWLAVGPEGGFSRAETDWLAGEGFAGLRLGPRVLRTETAGPAMLAILQARFGDLG